MRQIIHLDTQIQLLYVNFAARHYPTSDDAQLMYVCGSSLHIILFNVSSRRPTLSHQRLQSTQHLTDEELYNKMRRAAQNKHDLQVLESFLVFNQCVLFLHNENVVTIAQGTS